jgi:hypothetical protein
MIFDQLVELIWNDYQAGSPSGKNQTFRKGDVKQQAKLLLADLCRQRWYESKLTDEYRQPDYSFFSPMLTVKKFPLAEANIIGKRRADMSGFSLYRLPKNSHFTNVYPIAKKGGCGNEMVGEITQVSPGEENFYINSEDHKSFYFFVVKGSGIDTYNLPPCIESLEIEATYDGDDMDVDEAMASKIHDHILGVVMGVNKQYYSEQAQKQMQEQNVIK